MPKGPKNQWGKNNPRYTHGMTGTGVYQTWFSMIARCYKPKNDNYRWYGAQGISVCKRWHNFKNFYLDMGARPVGHSIDRINGRLGYSKKNCRWAIKKEQVSNLSNNRNLTYNGTTKHLNEWAREVGLKRRTLGMRIDNYGWSVERALTTKTLYQQER